MAEPGPGRNASRTVSPGRVGALRASLTQRLSPIGQDNLRIVRGLVLVAGFVFVGKLLGAAKEVVIAWRYGMGAIVDGYLIALTFATWVPAIWASVLNAVFVPLVHRLDPSERHRFVAELGGVTLIAAGLVSSGLYLLMPLLLRTVLPELPADQASDLLASVRLLAPLAGLGLVIAQLSVQLLADERHANTLLESMPPLALGATVLVWAASDSADPLVVGTLCGAVLQVMGLALLLRGGRFAARPSPGLSSPAWRTFRDGIGIMVLGQIVMSFVDPVSALIAARLGEGNVAGLGYASRILALFLTLGATSVGRAILPVLSNSERSGAERVRLAYRWAALMALAGSVAAALAWWLAPFIVRLLLERGEFTAADSKAVIEGVRLGVMQFPFYFSGIVFVQLVASLGAYRLIFISSVIALTVKVASAWLFAELFGFAGILLANVPMYAATAVFFAVAVRRLVPPSGERVS